MKGVEIGKERCSSLKTGVNQKTMDALGEKENVCDRWRGGKWPPRPSP